MKNIEEKMDQVLEALPHVEGHIHEIALGNKINAWNCYVHEFSDPDADFYFIMDGDIVIAQKESLSNMLATLQNDSHISIATSTPKKSFPKHCKNPMAFLLSITGEITRKQPSQLTGHLYGSRGSFLRNIHMPLGLMIEDGFIKTMAVTQFMTESVNHSKIERVTGAVHQFKPYLKIRDIYHHQVRQAVGQTFNYILHQWLETRVSFEQHAGNIIELMNRDNPRWFQLCIQKHVSNSSYWVLYPNAFKARFQKLKHLSWLKRIAYFPISFAFFLVDLVILFSANRKIKSGKLEGGGKD